MHRIAPFVVVMLVSACGSSAGLPGATGNADIFLTAEDTIPHGLTPGTAGDSIQDGWTVTYEKFLMVVGNVRARSTADPRPALHEPTRFVVDLKNLPTAGLTLASFAHVAAERFDKVGYDTPAAQRGDAQAPGLDHDDYQHMIDEGLSHFVQGTLTKPDGASCDPQVATSCVAAPTVHFTFDLRAGTSFDDCADAESAGGAGGFAVPAGGTAQVKPTIHGDHWFFDNIAQGSEEITHRQGQWIANCDLDHDGTTTTAELAQVRASDAFPASKGYVLTGAIVQVNTALDFVNAQAHTLGHLDGDGDCPTRGVL